MKNISVSMTKRESLIGWIYLPVQFILIPFVIMLINIIFGSPLNEAEVNFVYFLVNFFCIWLIFWRFLVENGKIAIADPGRTLKGALYAFGLYWLLSFAVSFFIITIYPNFTNVNDDSIAVLVQENSQLMTVGTVLLVPIAEEVLYRGLLFRSIYKKSPVLAYIVSIVVFGSLHVVSYIGNFEPIHLLLCLLQYIPAGFCLGWAYARTDSIWAPILMHITINQIGMLAMM